MEKEKILIDGSESILGRVASYAAKESLKGKEVVVVNVEKVLLSGNKRSILKEYFERTRRVGSSQKGPKIIRTPERILKRTIRGMLDHKRGRGGNAFKNVKCYNQIPKEYEGKEFLKIGKLKGGELINLKELCQRIK